MPRARRLTTTPEMIWSTRNVTDIRAWSAAIRPPVTTATPIDAHSQDTELALPSERVGHEADAGAAQHHPLDADVDHAGALAPQAGHGPERDRRPEPQRLDQQLGRRWCSSASTGRGRPRRRAGGRALRWSAARPASTGRTSRVEEGRSPRSARRWPPMVAIRAVGENVHESASGGGSKRERAGVAGDVGRDVPDQERRRRRRR